MIVIQGREKQILKYLLKKGTVSLAQIAQHLNLSTKTISKSIKQMKEDLLLVGVELVSKPKVGVYLTGEIQNLTELFDEPNNQLPTTKDERIIYICTRLLQEEKFITMQQLADELYISKGSLEKDFIVVYEVFEKYAVDIQKVPGKGIKLELNEFDRRQLTSKIIQLFWSDHWYVKEEADELRHFFEKISSNLAGIFSTEQVAPLIECVNQFSQEREMKFSDYGFQSLIIHLAIAIERIAAGDLVADTEKAIMTDPLQEANTDYLVEKLEQALKIEFPEFEKKYINIHLSAESHALEQPMIPSVQRSVDDDLTGILKAFLGANHYDNELIKGLGTHLSSALKRIDYGLTIKNPYIETIKRNFSYAFEKAVQLKKELEKLYQIVIDDDETTYIAIHIQAYLERHDLINQHDKTVILVCSSGRGTSQLLAARIRKYFPQLKVSRVLSVQELVATQIVEDFVISTIFLELEGIPVVNVSPLLEEQDIHLIEKRMVETTVAQTQRHPEFSQLIKKELLFMDLDVTSYTEVIEIMGQRLVELEMAESSIIQSSIKREGLSFTSFKGYATPHGQPIDVKQSGIVFASLRKPILWGNEIVDYVFFLALKDESPKEMERLYESLLEILDQPKVLGRVLEDKSFETLYNYFVKGDP